MKILLLTGSINQGGAEFQLLALANLLQRKGHDVQVLALTDYTYFLPYISENALQYTFVPNDGSKLKRLSRAVYAIRKIKPDLVISYIRATSLVAILARVATLFRFKLIISERTSLVQPGKDLFYFNLALLANKVTVNSTSKYTYIRNRFPLLKSRSVFIPNIINISRFLNLERIQPINGNVRIGYVGRISPEKNLLNLIKAIRIIVDKGYKITLSLTGASNSKKYLEEVNQMIEELDLKNTVTYAGPTKDVLAVYRETDLLCLISIFEGFSNVISEAISCGIPIIASDIEENRYLVEDKINGFLVEPLNPEMIAEGLERFLKLTTTERDIISINNREKAKAVFNEDVIYGTYKELFDFNPPLTH